MGKGGGVLLLWATDWVNGVFKYCEYVVRALNCRIQTVVYGE
jgi:hypothetical protein